MTIRDAFLTNTAYGFPSRGHVRRVKPPVLAVVHITANMAPAQNQRDYANRASSGGPSAHYYIDRDGSGLHAVDETKYAAWSNGNLDHPLTSNAGVKALQALANTGFNVNEGCYLEIECVGTDTQAGQWTDEQFATVAQLLRDASAATGLPISDATVLPHTSLDSVNRPYCPSLDPAVHMSRLLGLAQGGADMPPAPLTDESAKLVDIPAGATLLELDGKTSLGTTGATALLNRPSPYGTSAGRYITATINGVRRPVIVHVPDSAVHPLPITPASAPASYSVTVGGKAVGSVTLP